MPKPIEYRFTLPDGSERFEIVDPDAGYSIARQVRMFQEMHGAVRAAPVDMEAEPCS